MPSFREVKTRAEIASVTNLAREIWTEYYLSLIGRAQVDYMLDKFQGTEAIARQIQEGYLYYLVLKRENPIGYFAVALNKEKQDEALLSKIYIKKSRRGRGEGKATLRFAENFCCRAGMKKLWLTVNKGNHPSIAWYQGRGFFIRGTWVTDIGSGFVMDDYIMEKDLGNVPRKQEKGKI